MAGIYLEALHKELSRSPLPEFKGASGYFSRPAANLDPNLFEGDHLKPEVRNHILAALYRFWRKRGYQNPLHWSTAWIAGSGASYQWAADRGNGDLDILIGVDWPAFYRDNSPWGHLNPSDMTGVFDAELRTELWPRTAETTFGARTYEVTYYVNEVATDIRTINPYAAYNLTVDAWTVRPSRETAYDHDFPADWTTWGENDLKAAEEIRAEINRTLEKMTREMHGPRLLNLLTALSRAADTGTVLLQEIHGGRRAAFAPGGRGYLDYTNWRWQKAKQTGVVRVLKGIEDARRRAADTTQRRLYGQLLPDATSLTARAADRHRNAG